MQRKLAGQWPMGKLKNLIGTVTTPSVLNIDVTSVSVKLDFWNI